MASIKVDSVEEYLAAIPADRRNVLEKVRKVILDNLPKGFVEMPVYGMIAYGIPLVRYPDTYNKEPLCIAAIASQKNYMSLYLMTVYGNKQILDWFVKEYDKSGKKLDMGKSCVRFRKIEDLPLDLIGKVIGRVDPEKFIEVYEKSREKVGKKK